MISHELVSMRKGLPSCRISILFSFRLKSLLLYFLIQLLHRKTSIDTFRICPKKIILTFVPSQRSQFYRHNAKAFFPEYPVCIFVHISKDLFSFHFSSRKDLITLEGWPTDALDTRILSLSGFKIHSINFLHEGNFSIYQICSYLLSYRSIFEII